MPIEKAFAIHASPYEIFAAIERDLDNTSDDNEGEGAVEVIRRDPGKSIEMRIDMGGMPAWLTYRLDPKEDYTEVVATLVPFGWRYTLFKIMSLGMRDQNFEIPLVEALANLKAAVENDGTAPEDLEDDPFSADEEPR